MKKITFCLGVVLFSTPFFAQNKCSTMEMLNKKAQTDPAVMQRINDGEAKYQEWLANPGLQKRVDLRIPVVVHVLYNDGEAIGTGSNISDAQINSQIEILNLDFRGENPDSLNPNDGGPGAAFHQYWGKRDIEFCLAKTDPQGNPTTGITRTQTDTTEFDIMGYETFKFTQNGGKDNWDPTKYLNIWVCKAKAGWLGRASFPTDLSASPELDGVVVRYEAFGTGGSAGTGNFANNNLGRTATHEVGHWLFLRHIWGDNQPNCGDDEVTDTPMADEPNYGLTFSFPLDAGTCDNSPNGQMYMNYMDYGDDAALTMFTEGQFVRMEGAVANHRVGLMTSTACNVASTNEIEEANKFSIYPNPSKGILNFMFFDLDKHHIVVTNVLGDKVHESTQVSHSNNSINLSELNEGVYFVSTIKNGTKVESKRIVLVK